MNNFSLYLNTCKVLDCLHKTFTWVTSVHLRNYDVSAIVLILQLKVLRMERTGAAQKRVKVDSGLQTRWPFRGVWCAVFKGQMGEIERGRERPRTFTCLSLPATPDVIAHCTKLSLRCAEWMGNEWMHERSTMLLEADWVLRALTEQP